MSALTDSLIKMATNQKWQMASCDTNESKTRLAYWNTLLKQHEDIFKQQGAGIVQNKHTASVSLTFTYIYIYQAEQHEHPIGLVFHRWWTFLPRHSFSLSFCHFALGRVVACLSLFARNDWLECVCIQKRFMRAAGNNEVTAAESGRDGFQFVQSKCGVKDSLHIP